MTYDPERPVYLRIGDWHENEISRNFARGDQEYGVSVYDLDREGGIVVPPDGAWSEKDLLTRLRLGATRHLVQGEISGTGEDGEPLLRGLSLVGTWPHDLPSGFLPSMTDTSLETVVAIADAPAPVAHDDPLRSLFAL